MLKGATDMRAGSGGGWTFIIWEPEVSAHMMPLALALSRDPRVNAIRSIAQCDLAPERVDQGWQIPDHQGVDVTIAPDAAAIAHIFDTAPADAIHIMMGMRRVPVIVAALAEAQKRGARYGLFSEPRVLEGISGMARLAQTWLTEGRLRRSADFVLAVGRHGPRWFRLGGYSRARIFDFAYFVTGLVRRPDRQVDPDRVRIGYVGRLTPSKGIDVFLAALRRLPGRFAARVAGRGEREPAVMAAADQGLLDYAGVLPMSAIPAFLHALDILVVPSTTMNDGWAAVVSEGLMSGTLVVASERVGGSICLDDPLRGEVVPAGSPGALADAIVRAGQPDRLTPAMRERRRQWAMSRISAEAGAHYLLDIMAHVYARGPRPAPFHRHSAA